MSNTVVATSSPVIVGSCGAISNVAVTLPGGGDEGMLAFAQTVQLAQRAAKRDSQGQVAAEAAATNNFSGEQAPDCVSDPLSKFVNQLGFADGKRTVSSGQAVSPKVAQSREQLVTEANLVATLNGGFSTFDVPVACLQGGQLAEVPLGESHQLAQDVSEIQGLSGEEVIVGQGLMQASVAGNPTIPSVEGVVMPAGSVDSGSLNETEEVLVRQGAGPVAAPVNVEQGATALLARDPVGLSPDSTDASLPHDSGASKPSWMPYSAQATVSCVDSVVIGATSSGAVEPELGLQNNSGSLSNVAGSAVQALEADQVRLATGAGDANSANQASRPVDITANSINEVTEQPGGKAPVDSIAPGTEANYAGTTTVTDNTRVGIADRLNDNVDVQQDTSATTKVADRRDAPDSRLDLATSAAEGQKESKEVVKPSSPGSDGIYPGSGDVSAREHQSSESQSRDSVSFVVQSVRETSATHPEEVAKTVSQVSIPSQDAPTVISQGSTTPTANPWGAEANPFKSPADGVGQQIADSVQASFRAGDRELEVRLNPPELGSIFVRLEEKGDFITGVLEISKGETRREIEQALPQIIQTLQEAGVQVRRLDLTVTDQQARDFGRDQLQQDSPDQQGSHGNGDETEAASRRDFSGAGRLQRNAAESQKTVAPLADGLSGGIDMLI